MLITQCRPNRIVYVGGVGIQLKCLRSIWDSKATRDTKDDTGGLRSKPKCECHPVCRIATTTHPCHSSGARCR